MFFIARRIYFKLRLFRKFWKSYFASRDIVDSMLEINMGLFCEFYDRGGIDKVDWEWEDSRIEVKSKMDEIYNWWKVERKKRLEEIDVILDTWGDHHVTWWKELHNGFREHCSATNKYADYLFELLSQLESSLEKETEKYLVWLMEMRNYLWT